MTVLIEVFILKQCKTIEVFVQTIRYYHASMSKTQIFKGLPKLTKMERQETHLKLAEPENDDWLDDEELLTVHEMALVEARLAALCGRSRHG
jgi:hypothetical protein